MTPMKIGTWVDILHTLTAAEKEWVKGNIVDPEVEGLLTVAFQLADGTFHKQHVEPGSPRIRWTSMTIPELYERVLWRDFSDSVPQNLSWFERHREHIVEEVVTKHLETLPRNPRKGSAEKPIAVFVAGTVGSGKAVFAKRMLQAFS